MSQRGVGGGGDDWRDVLVAVDVGTSGARAAAFDLDGRRRLEVRRAFPTTSPRPGWAEQDASAWRSASLSALGELVARIGTRRRVHAIGLTGQCPSVVLVDGAHRPIRPALIYRDNRAVEESAEVRARFGERAIHELTGHLPAAFHILPKLLWVRRHDAAAFERTALVLQPRDWIALALSGQVATDGTHAAATLLYDVPARRWSDELIGAFDLDQALLPPILPSAAVVGGLLPSVVRRLGLPGSTPVVLGGADSQACAFGAGVVGHGPVSEMAGSSTCLNAVVDAVLPVLAVTHYPHVVGPSLTTETGINTTGAAVAWLADRLYGGRSGRARSADFARLDAEAAVVPAGADGVLSLAVLGDGERTDPDLRGALVGLSLRHGRAELARAMLEGAAFEIRDQLRLLAEGGAPATELRVSGGDTRLGTWNRIKADVIGLPVRTVPGDAAVTGVAMLAGLGVGVYASAEEAIQRCVHPEPTIEPDARAARAYDELFGAWRELAASPVVRREGPT
ncbi:MAG TPA: FGGY family carbohydrate kinase [Candidatus Limnocylindrales bacterium]|nr:FGGY family carbohydrate kinase [Candidatus Limnocylindrales bacterium]